MISMRGSKAGGILTLAFGLGLAASKAADLHMTSPLVPDAMRAIDTNWHLTVGAGARFTPDYLGSSKNLLRPFPIFALGRGLLPRYWSAEDDMLSIGLLNGPDWRLGLSGNLLWQRQQSSSGALRGLGDVKFGFEGGIFGEAYLLPWLRLRADLRRGFFAHEAFVGDFKIDAFSKIGEKWIVGIGPRLSVATSDFNRTYFGVGPAQSIASGLPVYSPRGGLLSAGFLAQASYLWTPKWRSTAYVEYKRLLGDAATAPLVRQRGTPDQVTFGFSTSYSFDLGF